MRFIRCALGVIQQRGKRQIPPQTMQLGTTESNYFARHVEAVRKFNSGSSRAGFVNGSAVSTHLMNLATATQEAEFIENSRRLQELLAAAMRGTTGAKDCVFAVLRFYEPTLGADHVTVLKLDAIIEAAQYRLLQDNAMDFRVLTDLLPEPGDLQKGLSWPDPRPDSEVMTVDRNSVSAAYFENAFDLRVSLRAKDAETELLQQIAETVPAAEVAEAIAAVQTNGSLDVVLGDLADDYPELRPVADARGQDRRPPGNIRADSFRARLMVWDADGIKVQVPSHLLGRVEKRQVGDGWEIVVQLKTEPKLRPS